MGDKLIGIDMFSSRCFVNSSALGEDDLWAEHEPQREALIERGSGQYLYDDQGARYIDCVNSIANVGHCNPAMNGVTCEAMKLLSPSTPYYGDSSTHGCTRVPSTPYEKMIKKTLPPHLDTVLFCDSGSEAIDLAVRLSRLWHSNSKGTRRFNPGVLCGFEDYRPQRKTQYESLPPQYNNRFRGHPDLDGRVVGEYPTISPPDGDVLVVEGSYHGCSNSLREFSNRLSDEKNSGGYYSSNERHVHVAPLPDVYRTTASDQVKSPHDGGITAAVQRHLRVTNQMLENIKTSGRELSCFLCEPLLTIQGAVYPPPSWLQGMYRMNRELFPGSLCIADEVQSGMGRLGEHFWGFQAQGVIPDIIVAGKSLGNGYPMAIVITSKAVANVLGPAKEMYFCSNVHNSIGTSVLEVINNEHMMETAHSTGQQLQSLLKSLKKKHDYVGDVRGVGLLHAIEIVWSQKLKTPSREIAEFIVHKLRRRGVVMVREGIHKNVLIVMPPMTFNDLDAASLVTKLDEVLYLVSHNFNHKLGNVPGGDSDYDRNFPGNSSGLTKHRRDTSNNHSSSSHPQNNSSSSSSHHSFQHHSVQRQSSPSSSRRDTNLENSLRDELPEVSYNNSPTPSAASSYCPPSTSSNNNDTGADSSDDLELVESLRRRRNIFSNIVFVERNTDQDILRELNDPNEDSQESSNSLRKGEKSSTTGDSEMEDIHPDELPKNCGIPNFGMGMLQPLSTNQPGSGYLADFFPNDEEEN